ncbi:helix-turn-helix domain-containing protein [bacterium]|nr:helix-turn-helix domain-containing protein [bacterium]
MKEYLTTTSAARLAGVGVSSIKRWADDGKLRTVRTPGGHRRLIRSDLVAFLSNPESRNPEGHSAISLMDQMGTEWADAILNSEFHALQAKLLDARGRNGSWLTTMDELASGVKEMGVRWTKDLITIAEEHVATDRLSRVLSSVYEAMPVAPNAPRCLLSSAEGDMHTLGLAMLQVGLREMGWRCLWLGSLTPMNEVCNLLKTSNVDMVALSASRASNDEASLALQLSIVGPICQKTNTKLILGGRGAWPDPLNYGTRFQDFSSLTHLIKAVR